MVDISKILIFKKVIYFVFNKACKKGLIDDVRLFIKVVNVRDAGYKNFTPLMHGFLE
jgi:hypothetical protein